MRAFKNNEEGNKSAGEREQCSSIEQRCENVIKPTAFYSSDQSWMTPSALGLVIVSGAAEGQRELCDAAEKKMDEKKPREESLLGF